MAKQVLCFEEKKIDSPAKLYVMEVGRDKDAPGGVFRLSPQQIPNAADAPNDFPVAMQASCSRGGGADEVGYYRVYIHYKLP